MVAAVARHTLPRATRRAQATIVDYWPIGGAAELWRAKDAEILIEGPAGTGKTVACLEKIHRALTKYAGSRWLACRKTQKSLKESALVTYQNKVLHPLDGVTFYGGSESKPAAFRYPNGSELLVAGLDNPEKVKSSEYDGVYVNEATEIQLDDWEMLKTRLRNGVMPYQQLIADCNPTYPTHWLNQRCNAGMTRRILSRHEENPRYWDPKRNQPTGEGVLYIATLDALTGVRKLRLRDGKWVRAEGVVFGGWRRDVHVVTRDQLPGLGFGLPKRHIAAVDWGWTKPFVISVFAIDGDGRMLLVHEFYMTHYGDDAMLAKAQELQRRYDIDIFVCDPSEPAYINKFKEGGLHAEGAVNAILPGITAIENRLALDGAGRPRFCALADCLEEQDPRLLADRQPTSGLEEVDIYVWPKNHTGKRETPVDEFNHAMDTWRYAAMEADGESQEFAPVDGDLAGFFRRAGVRIG